MRKRIAVVTFHRAYNYGAVLQACALTWALRENGAVCELLDYYPRYFKNMYCVLPSNIFSSSGMKTLFCHTFLWHILAKRNKGFERFLKENASLSETSYDDLKNTALPYDAFIAGSDQIWSPSIARFDPVFFLSTEVFSGKLKYSYAASFGLPYIPEELRSAYQKRLNDYRLVSVRERSGISIIESLTGKKSVVSCDPSLLPEIETWNKLCGETPVIKGEYIFLYYVKQPAEIREYAARLAEKTNCKVVCLSCIFSNSNRNRIFYMSGTADRKDGFLCANTASPDEFLNLIKYAKYVLTSSFHGTVFSILFHKLFLTQTVWNDGGRNERVLNLLDSFALTGRSINEANHDINRKVNWREIDEKIYKLRREGVKYLQMILDDVNSLESQLPSDEVMHGP